MGGGVEIGLLLHLPHHLRRRPRRRAARVLPRPGARLGRLLTCCRASSASRTPSRSSSRTRCSMNRMLKGPQAFELGMADAMFEPVRLPRGLAGLGRRRSSRGRDHGVASRGRPRRAALGCRGRSRRGGSSTRRSHGAAPAPYRALELVAAARTASREEAFAAEDEALADLLMSDELRAGLYAFDLVQKRAKRPAGAPDRSAGPPGHQGRHRRRRADGQPARTAVRPAAGGAGRADRPRPGPRRQGRGLRPRRDRHPARQGPDQPRPREPAQGAGDRLAPPRTASPTPTSSSRRSSRTSRSSSRSSPRSRPWSPSSACWPPTRPRCRSPRWPRASRTPSGSSGSTSSTRSPSCRCWRSSVARPTDEATLATAFATGRTLKKTCVLVQDSPSFVVNRLLGRLIERGVPGRRRGHATGGGRPLLRRPRPADAAVRAARAGRPGDRAAQHRDAAPGLPGPVLRLGEPAPGRRGGQDGLLRLARGQAGRGPRGRGTDADAVRAGRAGRGPGARAGAVGAGGGGPAHAGRGRRRRVPRTSTSR